MMRNLEAGSSLSAQFLHHVTRRRSRVYGAVAVALVLLSGALWMYGGFAMVDFTTAVPRPHEHVPPPNTGADVAHGANDPPPIVSLPPPIVSLPPPIPTENPVNGVDTATQLEPTQIESTQVDPTHTSADHPGKTVDLEDLRHSAQNPAAHASHGIPPKIWQILLPKKTSPPDWVPNPKMLEDTPSWLTMNPNYA